MTLAGPVSTDKSSVACFRMGRGPYSSEAKGELRLDQRTNHALIEILAVRTQHQADRARRLAVET